MAEYMTATLTVGGRITRAQLKKIRKLAEIEGADMEISEISEQEITIIDDEAPWGKFEQLEQYLIEQRIPFNRHSEAKYEYDAEIVFYRPDYCPRPLEFLATQEGQVAVNALEILEAIERTTTREELVAELRALAAADVPELPRLEVVDESV